MIVTNQAVEVEKPQGSARASVAVLLVLVAGLSVGFAQNFADMWTRWFPAWHITHYSLYQRFIQGESYYTHGPLVPLVSLLIVFLLIRFTKVPVQPRPGLGFTVLGLSILAHLAACLARINFLSMFAFVGILAGIVLVLWGSTALRRLWFPIAFLMFMVPLPEVSIAQLNFRLKMVAAESGVFMANLLGIIAERSGNRVFLEGDKTLVIANICNGLRTLITVIAFGALYAYVCKLRGVWRFALFVLSVPVALASNAIRIMGLIVVAHFWDEKTATGWFHDTSGALILVVAFLMMFGIEQLILRVLGRRKEREGANQLFQDVRRGPEDQHQALGLFRATGAPRGWAVIVLIALTAAGALWLNRSTPPTWTQSMARKALPEVLMVDGKEWRSYDMELDELTLTILETTDYLCRHYYRDDAPFVEFSIIFSKDNRKGTHPPDLCLAGAGDGITAKGTLAVADVEGRGDIECNELIVQSGANKICHAYIYKCGNDYTRSFWKQQFVILWNGLLHRDASGALIRLSTPIVNDNMEEARRRITDFLRVALPYLDKGLR